MVEPFKLTMFISHFQNTAYHNKYKIIPKLYFLQFSTFSPFLKIIIEKNYFIEKNDKIKTKTFSTYNNENVYNLLRFRLLCFEPMTSRLFLFVGVANRGVLQGPVCGLDEQEVQNSIEQPCLEHVPTFFSPSTWQGNEHFGHGNKCSQGASVRLACKKNCIKK